MLNNLLERGYTSALFDKVTICNVSIIKSPKVLSAIARETTNTDYANYAAASDLARLEILRLNGGIYMDVDVATRESLGELGPQKQSTTRIPTTVLIHQETVDQRIRFSNAVIASEKGSNEITKMVNYALAPYEGKLYEMGFAQTIGKGEVNQLLRKYEDQELSLNELMWVSKRHAPSIRMDLTVVATGPGVVSSYLYSLSNPGRMAPSKTIQNPENFGRLDTSEGRFPTWTRGMNAAGSWQIPKGHRRSTSI